MFYIENSTAEEIDIARVECYLNKVLEHFNESRDFSLHFITDEEIKTLNEEYRGISAPTDILTFRLADGDEFPMMEEAEELGDIFISLDSMRRNAREFGASEDEELLRLLIHGVMHLIGYDHESNDFDKEPMLIEQEEALRAIKGSL